MLILQLLYFMLPAYLANIVPVLVRKVPFLAGPLDCRTRFRGLPLLGKNKTWRGLITGILTALIVVYLQQAFATSTPTLLLPGYTPRLLAGFLLGLGALLGDAIESFIKRQLKIKEGKALLFADQLDFTIGALALTAIVYFPGWLNALYILLLSTALHFIINVIGYTLKIRKQAW